MACRCTIQRKAERLKSKKGAVLGTAPSVLSVAAAATATEDDEKRDDDEPYALVVENIAKAVIHSKPPSNRGEFAARPSGGLALYFYTMCTPGKCYCLLKLFEF